MSVEDRLADALSEYDRVDPAPDLFARVERSVTEDRLHRRRVRTWAPAVGAAAVGAGAVVWSIVEAGPDGVMLVRRAPMIALELLMLLAVVIALGPNLDRFGAAFVADVFRLRPETGHRFRRLLDVAYYLVFGGYIVVGASLRGSGATIPLARSLETVFERLAGLLLLMGGLHAVTLVVLPVIGLVFSSTVRRHLRERAGAAAPPESPAAAGAEQAVRWILLAVAASVVATLLLVMGVLLGLGVDD